MLITHIDIYRFSIPMVPFTIATGTMDYAQNIFIRIHTTKGFYGVGEASAFPMIVGEAQDTLLVLAKEFAKLWKGKNPLDIEDRLTELNSFIAGNSTCKSAFDMALYDIAAKNTKQPLYQFLGGKPRIAITDMTIGINSPQQMANEAIKFKQKGAQILKVKLGKKVADDVERIKQIRKAVGEDVTIRIDANQGWDFEQALTALTELAKYDIEFCEQPMRTWYDDLLPELVRLSPIKIMADESCYHHHDARKLIKAKACDAINIKFSKSGGINEGLKIYHEAMMHNIPCMIGGMLETRIAASAKLHFAYACSQINYFDLDTSLLGHLVDPVIGGLVYNNFKLSLPKSNGIGADADEAFLKDCEKWVI